VNRNSFRALVIQTKQQTKDYKITGGDYVFSGMPVKKLSEAEYRRISQMFKYRTRDR
jgi:hypothetical protein